MKTCRLCKVELSLDNFHKDRSRPDGYAYKCKNCYKTMPSQKRGTFEFFCRRTWNNLNKRAVNGSCAQHIERNKSYFEKGIELQMTKTEFYDFCKTNRDLIMNFYKQGEIPSIDRIDSNSHYALENVRIISLTDNITKAYQE